MVDSLRKQGIAPQTVLDIGANIGQFAIAAVKLLKPDMVYSFEPVPDVARVLRNNLATVKNTVVCEQAIGDHTGFIDIHVNVHSHSSSLLQLGSNHLRAFPNATCLSTIQVPITTIDAYFSHIDLIEPVLVKLDVQGSEEKALLGARVTLSRTRWVVAETSLKPLYEGEILFTEILETMKSMGFRFLRPVGFLRDPRTQEIIQLDALFERVCSDSLEDR
jgi:FkbM family methyltransferase